MTTEGREEALSFWREHCEFEVFSRDYSGYWACGVARDPELGWLVRDNLALDDVDEPLEAAWRWLGDPPAIGSHHPEDQNAIDAWKAGIELPDGFYRLDDAAVVRCYEAAEVKYGVGWFDEVGDAITYDVALQLGLFGVDEPVYG